MVAFSDGVTEAMSKTGEEYGEDRLQACVEANRQNPPQDVLDAIFASVREFTTGRRTER
jgi:sigma-B regulation protein RsbU (phosphoserine phosphatase)